MKIDSIDRVSNNGVYIRAPTPESLTPEEECIQWASLTNDYRYYKRLAFLRDAETKAAREEIMRKYPYNGKSTFSELLEEGMQGKMVNILV